MADQHYNFFENVTKSFDKAAKFTNGNQVFLNK